MFEAKLRGFRKGVDQLILLPSTVAGSTRAYLLAVLTVAVAFFSVSYSVFSIPTLLRSQPFIRQSSSLLCGAVLEPEYLRSYLGGARLVGVL
jgi:hypothetical protein